MGSIKSFEPEKLVVGIMYTDEDHFRRVTDLLTSVFGNTDAETEEYSFSDYSGYYDAEMDGRVMKRFVSFERLMDPSALSEIKVKTNSIEDKMSVSGNRRVNIDPCLLSHGRFVMATTKGASFRVPLSEGIYADLSLVYSRGEWTDFFWTYADVRSDRMKAFLSDVRRIYLEQRKVQCPS
ncbi:MAG: DUF4416 family protein [Clostridia bacterium]|nr:DUF4416 family protein [Clostridia bacterium]